MISMRSVKFFLTNPTLIFAQYNFNKYHKDNPGLPWMTPDSIEFLKNVINDDFRVFEWGSGKSTKWYAAKSKQVISVEHNKEWYDKVQSELKAEGHNNIDYRYSYIETEDLDQKKAIEANQIPKYVAEIETCEDNSLDLVIIDGSFRHICVQKSLKKVKPGKYLCIDNSNWTALENWGVPNNWNIVHDSDVKVSRTTIWQKPI